MNVQKWSITKTVLVIVLINVIAFGILFGLKRSGVAQKELTKEPIKIVTDIDFKIWIKTLKNETGFQPYEFQKKTIGDIILPDDWLDHKNKTISDLNEK